MCLARCLFNSGVTVIKHELNNIIFTITPDLQDLLHRTVKYHLINIGNIDMSLLVFMALNQLTLNQLVSASMCKNIEQLCAEHLSEYSFEQHLVIISTCEQIAAILYKEYQNALTIARMPLPSRMVNATYSCGVITMSFESMDDQSCTWSYTTYPQ